MKLTHVHRIYILDFWVIVGIYVVVIGVISGVKAWQCLPHCWKAAGTHGNGDPIVKGFKNAHELAVHVLWTAFRIIFRPKLHKIGGFCTVSFPGYTPEPRSRRRWSRPIPTCRGSANAIGHWIQTPISAWLAPQRSDIFCFTKRPLVVIILMLNCTLRNLR